MNIPLLSLGDDPLLRILSYLPTKESLRMSLVSRDFCSFVREHLPNLLANLHLEMPLPTTARQWGGFIDCRPRRVLVTDREGGLSRGFDLGYTLEMLDPSRLESFVVDVQLVHSETWVGVGDLDKTLRLLGRLAVLDLGAQSLTARPSRAGGERPVLTLPSLVHLRAETITPEAEGWEWCFQAPRLETLALRGLSAANAPSSIVISDLVSSCRLTLTDATLGFPWFRLHDAQLLQGCPNLRSLRLISHSTMDREEFERERDLGPPAGPRPFTLRNFSGLERLGVEAVGVHSAVVDEADLTWAMRRNPIQHLRLRGCSGFTGTFVAGPTLRELELEDIPAGMTWGMIAGILAHGLGLERLALAHLSLEDDASTFALSSEALKSLTLRGVRARSVPALGSLAALEELAITSCTGIHALRPAAPPKLRSLRLSRSLTSSGARPALAAFLAALRLHCEDLAEVDLSGTAADDSCLAALSGSPVSVLIADECEHLERPAVEDASHLRAIYLRGCPHLRTIQFSKARRLQAVFLRDCPRLHDDFRQFEDMTRLRILDLSSCGLVSNTLVSRLADAMLDLELVIVQGSTKVTRSFLAHDRFTDTKTRFLARSTDAEEIERILALHRLLRWERMAE